MSYCSEHRKHQREVEKHGIKLPDEIAGWLLLRRAGLSQEQRLLVPRKSTVFADGNRGWASRSADELGLCFHSATHQVKQFTKNVLAIAGMRPQWRVLKRWIAAGSP